MFSSRMTLFTGQLQKFHRVLALYCREVIQEILKRAAPGNIDQQCLRGTAGSHKDECPAQNFGDRVDGAVIEDSHETYLARRIAWNNR